MQNGARTGGLINNPVAANAPAADIPDLNVGVEDDYFAASQSSPATGANGCSNFNTDPRSGCFVRDAADETKTCTDFPSENGTGEQT